MKRLSWWVVPIVECNTRSMLHAALIWRLCLLPNGVELRMKGVIELVKLVRYALRPPCFRLSLLGTLALLSHHAHHETGVSTL